MRKVIKNNSLLILSIIVILGLFLRIYSVSNNPPSLNWDEVSHGYNAYSILKTGHDEWGKLYPTIFRAYGDYKLPVYIYATAFSVGAFGLNEFAVRFPNVLSGVITIFFTYLLAKELLKGVVKEELLQKIGLLSALLVAIEPWSLFLSRPAFEANMGLTFFVAGYYFLLRFKSQQKFLTISLILLGLSVWTYNSFRLFTPLMLSVFLFNYKNNVRDILKNHKYLIINMIIFGVLFVPMFVQLVGSAGSARYNKVAIVDGGAVGKIIALREQLSFNPNIERLAVNKYTYFATRSTLNWIGTYSPNFLFFEGGDNFQFSIPNHGLLYLIDLPFLLTGLYFVFKNRKKMYSVLIWILFAPIASSLTREAPHVLRNITLLPIPMVLTSIGVINAADIFSKNRLSKFFKSDTRVNIASFNKVVFTFLIIVFISLTSWYRVYTGDYNKNYSWVWQYGYKEAANFVISNYSDYDKIIVTKKYGEPHEFLLFYLKQDPSEYRTDSNLVRYNQTEWFWVDSFDKFVFVNEWDIPTEEWQPFITEKGALIDCTNVNCLLITDPDSVPKTWNKIRDINYLDGKTAFSLYSNKQK